MVDPDQRWRKPEPLVMYFKLKEIPGNFSASVEGTARSMGMRFGKDEPRRLA
jgi:hypothetical protein